MTRWMRPLFVCAIVMIMTTAAAVSSAQTAATGNIEGQVTDTTGAVLPGLTVSVRNVGTNATRETVTDANGRYRAASLQPGQYEVSASLSGFDVRPVTNVDVLVGQTAPVDLRMHPRGIDETITVQVEAPAIDTRRTDLSTVIGEQAEVAG